MQKKNYSKIKNKLYYPRKPKYLNKRAIWRSLKSPNHVYRHIVRGQPFALTNNNIGGGLSSAFAYSVQLQYLNNYLEFTALYDSYRIMKATFKFFPLANVNDMSGLDSLTNPAHLGQLYYAIDYDDGVLPSLAHIFEYANMKAVPYGKPFTVSFVPHVNADVSTVSSLGKQSIAHPWLDCANTDIVHYGFKGFVPDMGVGTNDIYTIISEYEIEFRGQK